MKETIEYEIIPGDVDNKEVLKQIIKMGNKLDSFNLQAALKERSEKKTRWFRELSKRNRKGEDRFNKYYKSWLKTVKVFVAARKDNGKLIGYIVGEVIDKPGYVINKIGNISELFIESKYRGLGIGESLLKTLTEHYKNKTSVKYVIIALTPSNTKAESLYTKIGAIFYEKELIVNLYD